MKISHEIQINLRMDEHNIILNRALLAIEAFGYAQEFINNIPKDGIVYGNVNSTEDPVFGFIEYLCDHSDIEIVTDDDGKTTEIGVPYGLKISRVHAIRIIEALVDKYENNPFALMGVTLGPKIMDDTEYDYIKNLPPSRYNS